jgi:hypothetical protein
MTRRLSSQACASSVGLAAPFVALAVSKQLRSARGLALGWNIFGFLDLLTAIGLGTGYLIVVLRAGIGAPPTAAAMTFFPLVLIPTFAVPVGIILHIYSIRRTLRGERHRAPQDEQVGIWSHAARTVSS